MKDIRRIGVNMISGGAGYLIPMAINLFSTPYVIKNLGKEAYGIQTLANVIIGYLVVADMGLDIPITKKVAEYFGKESDAQVGRFLMATIKMYFLIGAIGMAVVFIFTNPLISVLAIPERFFAEARIVFYLTAFGFLGSIVNMWGRAVYNGMHRYDIANGVSIFNNLFGILMGIFLIMKGYGVVGFFSARIGSFLLSNILYLSIASRYFAKANFFPFIDLEVWHYLKKQIGYGFSLRMSGMIFSRMDQTLISSWLGVAMVTVYSIPILIANTLAGLIASIMHFAFPMASALHASHSIQEMENFYIKISKFITALATLIFVPFLVVGDKFLAVWIGGPIASQSHAVLSLLLLAFYLNTCLTTALVSFVVGTGQLQYFTKYSIARGIVLLTGFIVFIKGFGIEGAGLSYVAALLLDIGFFAYTVKKKLMFNLARLTAQAVLKPMMPGLVLGALLYLVKDHVNTWLELALAGVAFSMTYIAIGLKIDIFGDLEKKAIFTLLKRR